MKKIHFLFFSFFLLVFISCSFRLFTKDEIIALTKKNAKKNDEQKVIEDNNGILKILTRDVRFAKVDEIYHFSEEGKQLKYTLISTCDSCFQKYLLNTKTTKPFGWRRFDDSTYFSKYSIKRVLKIHNSTFSYDVLENNQSKKEYELLFKYAKP